MNTKRHFAILGCALLLVATLWGCASIGNPSGGARDEDPPRFIAANPAPGSVNVDPSDIAIYFNELVNVKDAFSKVVLSPPGKSTPRVTTRGKGVRVNITDTLLENTTYTIDFGDAIEDNNEGNILSGFSYTFSTGPDLDSLRISGMVLGAEDMEPQQGVFVGAYTSMEDSVFLKRPFERLARTDEMGRFVIRGLKDTTYRIFALKDLDNDKFFANPEEDIAWYGDTIRPTSERIMAQDTIRDLYTGAVDTIVERMRTRFLPNTVLLRMFNTGVRPQYLVSYSRPDSTKLSFIFNAPGEKMPRVKLADDSNYVDPLEAETTVGNDTLTFFLPRDLAMRDTLKLAIEYVNTDVATGTPKLVNDTVKLMKPKPEKKDKEKKKKKKKKKKKEEKDSGKDATPDALALPGDSIAPLPVDSTGATRPRPLPADDGKDEEKEDDEEEDEDEKPPIPTFKFQTSGPDKDIRLPIAIEVPVPLAALDTLAFHLEEQEDSIWRNLKLPYRLQRADTLSKRRFKIEYPWERGKTYRLTVDSIAATDIYGVQSDKLQTEFKTKSEDEVSNLRLTLSGLDRDIPAFAQLMEGGDKPKYTVRVENGVADFKGIDGGKYYVRLYEDFNGDGRYTPGCYRLQRVYGTPDTVAADIVIPDSTLMRSDSLEVAVADSPGIIPGDSISVIAADSLGIAPADSLALEAPDSVRTAPAAQRMPLTDREAVERLVKMGYSLVPLESDSVGTDILIAMQPDLVYYYPKQINVKKAWDIDQSWNVFETALDLQKPAKIKKNKPKRKNNEQSQQEEEEEDEDDMFGNPFNPNDRNNRNNTNRNRTAGFQNAR